MNTIGGPPLLLRNEGGGGNWLQIGFDGFYPGAVVEVLLPNGRLLVREWQVGSSYLASEDPRLHVGLGTYTSAAQVTVRWTGRSWQQTDVPVNQLIVLP